MQCDRTAHDGRLVEDGIRREASSACQLDTLRHPAAGDWCHVRVAGGHVMWTLLRLLQLLNECDTYMISCE
jgi:hypothetical protein